MKRPFTVAEARRAGVSLAALRGKSWKRVGSELYCWAELPEDPWLTLSAWQQVLPADAVFGRSTAAWMHGLDFDPVGPVEALAPVASGLRSRAGLNVRRSGLQPAEVASIRGLIATTLNRTLLDLCACWTAVEALVAVDMALSLRKTSILDLWRYAEGEAGRQGCARLRDLVRIAAPAESPMETRLRWLLLANGLPRPQVQVDLRDEPGAFLGRADLFYRSAQLVVEFDGGNHRERLVSDDRRQNLLVNAGYRVLRFTTADLKGRPGEEVAQVRTALKDPFGAKHVHRTGAMEPFGAKGVKSAG